MPNRFNTRQRIPKGQSKKDNPEKLEAWDTQEEEEQQKHDTICVGHHYGQTNYEFFYIRVKVLLNN